LKDRFPMIKKNRDDIGSLWEHLPFCGRQN
jgi:hypothetical protein